MNPWGLQYEDDRGARYIRVKKSRFGTSYGSQPETFHSECLGGTF